MLERRSHITINLGGLTSGNASKVRELIERELIPICPDLVFEESCGLIELNTEVDDYRRRRITAIPIPPGLFGDDDA